ncbi:hypothetical protein C8R46DRAFT_1061982 [Mycena filopes]|nr:hypothetical protein C8R46DRAFT_1061982 [Mycena filopes]
MKLPQELIDLIIGEIFAYKDPDPFLDWRQPSPLNIYTLKSCTLLSRACVRQAQKQLFFALRFRPGRSTDERLPKLLSAPHICPYIRDLDLTPYAESAGPLLQFCKSLPNLQALSLHFAAGEWALHSVNVQLLAPLLATLRLPSLRCIQLSGPLKLGDAGQLHDLLKGTVDLKQLALESIGGFRRQGIDTPARRTKPVIVLDSLRLTDSGLSFADVDSMLEAFTDIDISHLRRLEISRSAGENLLRVNARTLQEVEIYCDPHLRVTPYRDAPIGAQKLRSITMTAWTPFDVVSVLQFLGPLADMAVLENVKITILHRLEDSYETIWGTLDASLSSAPRLRAVEMVVQRPTRGGSVDVFRALDSSGWRSPPGTGKDVPFPDYFDDKTSIPSRWLVGLAQKGILHIIST